MTSSSRYRVNAPRVAHEVFDDGEASIIHLKSGNYYSLDLVGSFMWALIAEGASVGEVVESLVERFEGDPSDMIVAANGLVSQLLAEDLVTMIPDGGGPSAEPSRPRSTRTEEPRKPFTMPVLERYSDMQELLLLDPVHEVDDTGWPRPKAHP